MKGRKQVLTWTFLSVFLLAQTTIFCIQDSAVQPKEQESAEGGLERRTRPVGHALVHRGCKTSPLRSEKRESYVWAAGCMAASGGTEEARGRSAAIVSRTADGFGQGKPALYGAL